MKAAEMSVDELKNNNAKREEKKKEYLFHPAQFSAKLIFQT